MLGDRIKELRNQMNIFQQDLAKALNVSKSTVAMWETNKREPNSEMLISLAEFFNCSVDYLIGRDTARINDDVLDQVNELDLDALSYYGNILEAQKEDDLIKKYRTLDEYGKEVVIGVADIEVKRCKSVQHQNVFTFRRLSCNKASAGCGYDLNDPDQWESVEVVDTPEARLADFAVKVEGRSMEPDYYDGDIVYIELASEVPIGQVGLFIQNGRGYIKEAGDGHIISRNPEFNDIFPTDGDIECKGRVIGVAELVE